MDKNSSLYRDVMESINQKISGDRAHLNLSIDLQPVQADGAHIPGELEWDEYVERLKSAHPNGTLPQGAT